MPPPPNQCCCATAWHDGRPCYEVPVTPEHFFETTIVGLGDGFPPVEQSILKRPMVDGYAKGHSMTKTIWQ